MAGGDLRLNNRKLKVKTYLKIFLILLKLILHHLTWVTNYMLLKFLHQTSKSCTQTTQFCQVKISRAAMKAAQEAAKSSKAPVKERKK
jgi:large subunit ribosomal protein L25